MLISIADYTCLQWFNLISYFVSTKGVLTDVGSGNKLDFFCLYTILKILYMKKFRFILILLCFLCTKSIAQTITHVTLTYYQPVKSQCDKEPLVTADGSKINLHHLKHNKIKWCAISRDLLYLFPKNKPKKVFIEGFGIYEVKDVMNKRHKHRIDILIHPKNSKRISIKHVKVKILK